jgi:tRNA threonylcarbamoyladenosine biosynthesis protein TsaE
VADALGVAQPVTSPTFTMIGEYAGSRRLFHVDLYRLRTADEAAGIGLEDYLDAPGITAVEWAERAAGFLGPDAIHIYFAALRHPRHRRILIHRP